MDTSLFRLLDANANRAREGLRVVEDYARFVLNDVALQGDLKSLRHDLTAAIAPVLPDAILHRDTPGDVGTAATTPGEARRQSMNDLVTAAGKRLGEALRAIEEAMKIVGGSTAPVLPSDANTLTSGQRPGSLPGRSEDAGALPLREREESFPPSNGAAAVEQIRYRFYAIEQRIARTLRPADRFANVRLYVLITESICSRPWLEAAEAAIDGGADCLQLREKSLDGGELLRRAEQLVALCHRRGVLCIINDRADVAVLAGADGVHLGQTDLPAVAARKIVGDRAIIGVSTHALSQARQAVLDGADYLGVGPVYHSETKPREILPGLAYAADAAREIARPCVAIAGITPTNVDAVLATGVQAIAVTASVVGAADIAAAARAMKARFAATLPNQK